MCTAFSCTSVSVRCIFSHRCWVSLHGATTFMVDPAHAFDVIYALEDSYFPLSKFSDFLNVYSLTKSFGIESLYLTIYPYKEAHSRISVAQRHSIRFRSQTQFAEPNASHGSVPGCCITRTALWDCLASRPCLARPNIRSQSQLVQAGFTGARRVISIRNIHYTLPR